MVRTRSFFRRELIPSRAKTEPLSATNWRDPTDLITRDASEHVSTGGHIHLPVRQLVRPTICASWPIPGARSPSLPRTSLVAGFEYDHAGLENLYVVGPETTSHSAARNTLCILRGKPLAPGTPPVGGPGECAWTTSKLMRAAVNLMRHGQPGIPADTRLRKGSACSYSRRISGTAGRSQRIFRCARASTRALERAFRAPNGFELAFTSRA